MPLLNSLVVPDSAQEFPVPKEQAVEWFQDTAFTVLDSANPFIPMGTQWGSGYHQVVEESDWYPNLATGEIIYWRVTGWEYSADYKTFTIHIRKGVTWNDGEPYTSADYVFTFNMLKEQETLYGHAAADEWIESVEAPDDYTVVIHLTKPGPRFHNNFHFWGGSLGEIRPEHIWKDVDPTTFKNWPPVETGPYILYGVYPELEMFVWERDEDYWAKKWGYFPAPKYFIGKKAPPPDIYLEDFVAGLVDCPLPHIFGWDMIQAAMTRTENITLAPYLDPCALGVSAFNLEKYPLNIREVRWAIALCQNREKVSALYPQAESSIPSKYPWPVPEYASFYNKYGPMADRAMQRIEDELGLTFEYNPDKAAEILDDLGFTVNPATGIRETPNGTVLSFEILSRPPPDVEYFVNTDLALELNEIGIGASVRTVDPAIWHELTQLGDYTIGGGSLCGADWLSGDMLGTFNNFHSQWYVPVGTRSMGGGVHGANPRYKNPELDAIADQLATMHPDAAEAQSLYEEGIYIVLRDMLCSPAVEKMFVQTFGTSDFIGWPSEDNMYVVPYVWWPTFIFVLFQIKPVAAPVTVVTTTLRETVTTTLPAETITTTVTATVPTMDVTSVAGAGIVALIVGVVVGWLVGSRRS